jgi:hypothetical protein
MENFRRSSSRRTPPPDVVRASSILSPAQLPRPAQPPNLDWLIIGLFALRLTKQMIEGLEHYHQSDADIAWLTAFLAPYPPEYALAKISGPRKDDYVATYQAIVSRMKRQPRYPMRFMQMNPDRSRQQGQGRREAEWEGVREMTDRTFDTVIRDDGITIVQLSVSTLSISATRRASGGQLCPYPRKKLIG